MPVQGSFWISFLSRGLVGGLAGVAIGWVCFAAPVYWRQSSYENIAKQIIAGDFFKAESLMSVKSTHASLETFPVSRVSALRAVAIINLRLLELEIAGRDQKNLDRFMSETEKVIRLSLINSPADPFLWTVLFWLENTRQGFTRAHLDYLRMSYLTGPNEGWVAIKRNRFTLAVFSVLTADLASSAIDEYSHFITSYNFNVAAEILEGPGWPIRDVLMSGLKGVNEISRQAFANVIYRRGLDLEIPGIERPDWRPWH